MASPASRFTTNDSLRGPGAVELLDEAAALLRRAPLPVVAIYLLGALPFWLGVIYFCFDMVQSANAEARMPGEALALAVLYFWMKTCQAVFARQLLDLIEGAGEEPWTLARWLRTALLQVIVAGSLPVVYPLALIATIPFAWVNAFYHNVSVVATGPRSTLGESCREAAELARLWPKQNHLALGILLLAAFVLMLNLAILIFSLPRLLNSLLGIETVLDESVGTWNNSSFYLCLFVFCYLLLNPLNKAVFVLRCFYGRSRTSGADLRANLRRRRETAVLPRVVAVAALLLVALPGHAGAAASAPASASSPSSPGSASVTPPPSPTASSTNAGDLNRAIDRTLQKDEFAWRMPRAEGTIEHAGFFMKLLNRVGKFLDYVWDGIGKMLGKLFDWILGQQRDRDAAEHAGMMFAGFPWRALVILLAVLALGFLLSVAVRHWRRTHLESAQVLRTITPIRSVDLEDDNVQADELPEDSWLALAQQLIEKGELRLALRALYLATLSALARRELVRLAVTKSNRDYLAELTRRLRGETSVVPFFRDNVRLFEASWYGTHDVTDAVIEAMRSNQQQVRGHVAA
jgi:hypothetical protein